MQSERMTHYGAIILTVQESFSQAAGETDPACDSLSSTCAMVLATAS